MTNTSNTNKNIVYKNYNTSGISPTVFEGSSLKNSMSNIIKDKIMLIENLPPESKPITNKK